MSDEAKLVWESDARAIFNVTSFTGVKIVVRVVVRVVNIEMIV